jgi:hypothetical protein
MTEASEPRQGVTGRIDKLVGDFMPGPDAPGGKRLPLAVPVHIFKDRVAVFKKPDPGHPQLVRVIQSSKDGSYRCALPPGEYTVVPVVDGELRYNATQFKEVDGKMQAVWPTIEVTGNRWTTLNISDTSQATF